MSQTFKKDIQFYKFSFYGFFKNLKFFEPFFILFLLEKGLSFWQIGVIYSVREITKNIFEIPSGIFADALGRRKTLILSFAFYILSFLGFYFSGNYILLLVSITFFAFGDAFRTGTNKAMIFDYITSKGWQDQKVHYYGNTRSWSQKGSAVSSLIAAAIVIAFQNYTVIFLASIVPYLINTGIVLSYPKSLEGKTHELNSIKIASAFKTTFRNLWLVIKSPSYWKIINLHAVHSGFHKSIKEYIQPIIVLSIASLHLLQKWSNERKEALFIGVIYFLIYILSSFASKSAGSFTEKLKSKEKALVYSLFAGLLFGVFTGLGVFLNVYWLGILFFILIYMNENLRKPIGVAAVAEKSDTKIMASVLSINSQAESFFAAIIAPILGVLIDVYSLGKSLIAVSTGIMFLSFLTHFLFKKKSKNLST